MAAVYSYIRNYFMSDRLFTVEAVLLDLKDPSKIIARTKYPLLVPEEYYEKVGYVPNVVFPSGALKVKKKIYLYYGASDLVCCVAFIDLDMSQPYAVCPKPIFLPSHWCLLPNQLGCRQ
jgi:predicted GH43/DUF377 family glycosyl hydrolase